MRGTLASVPIIALQGHRALVLGPTTSQSMPRPPLVLLGGTAQWLDSWTGHLTALARRRRVLLYETRGQGGGFAAPGTRQADDVDVGLQVHADDFWEVLEKSGLADTDHGHSGAVDVRTMLEPPTDLWPSVLADAKRFTRIVCLPAQVVAFSFGARVAMCAASDADASSRSSARLRRLCLTGVSADRGARGRLALQSWRQSLRAGDLAGFVWRLMLDTYSPATLAAQEGRIQGMVRTTPPDRHATSRSKTLAGALPVDAWQRWWTLGNGCGRVAISRPSPGAWCWAGCVRPRSLQCALAPCVPHPSPCAMCDGAGRQRCRGQLGERLARHRRPLAYRGPRGGDAPGGDGQGDCGGGGGGGSQRLTHTRSAHLLLTLTLTCHNPAHRVHALRHATGTSSTLLTVPRVDDCVSCYRWTTCC